MLEQSPVVTSPDTTLNRRSTIGLIPSPEDLAQQYERADGGATTKFFRSSYYRLVHHFREVFRGQEEQPRSGHTTGQLAAIEKFSQESLKANLPPAAQHAVELLSQPQVFKNIRQAGRMRKHSNADLPEEAVAKLCKEIRAALIWKASIEHAPENLK